jgi:sterol desaturase/sphingolipid hydroxylase (fatty acid hydroxylase superfamily)
MKAEEVIVLLVPVSFIVMAIIERIWPARKFPKVSNWHWIGLATFIYAAAMNTLLPLLLPEQWIAEHRLLNLSGLGVLPCVVIGHLAITLVTFAWHRATHEFAPLWRGFHQLHHSPRHLNIYAANMMHPTDLAVYIFLPTLTALFVLGVDPLSAAIIGNIGAFNAFFQHWNVRTPQWIGYLFQRPESHCMHHERGVHRDNYSDFPLWDILFGTFHNPKTWEGETGFDTPADARYGAMLKFADVNATIIGEDSFGRTARIKSKVL